ncbi:MAG: ABC transporter permease [Chloroflexi bacterium]|jgi:putative ABC transport system permease protein|nr:ABC transporter permease [Chloroflexota bacterium]
MNIGIAEAIGLALRAIGANRLRAFLTLIGISIGISAVIALLSIGTGVQDYINNQFTSAGTNLLGIVPGRIQRGPGGGPGSFGSSAFLTLGDYRAVVANVSNIEAHAADFTSTGNFAYESRTSQVQVSGVTPSFSQVRNWRPSIGRFIEEADNTSRSRVVVLGQTVRKDLFPEEDPIGKQVKINGLPFRVIGVMEEKGASFLGDQDAIAFIPLSTAQERLFPQLAQAQTGDRIVSTIYLQVTSDAVRPQVEADVREILRERHRLAPDDEDDFSIISQTELLETFGAVTSVLTLFLGAIAAISLLVGGIGIMNIMLVSVTERTREIGLRKAIGATPAAIQGQFLIEAVVLSMIGGLFGILLGVGLALGVTRFVDFDAIVQPQAVVLAVGFSAAVGLFFGLYPARRASKLNPIEALRFE